MPTARVLLADAEERLRVAGVPTPQVDAELLLAHVTGRPRAMLRILDAELGAGEAERFESLVAQRAERIPLQHLTGRAAFRYLDLEVGPGVFVPRPETELLVDEVLGALPRAGGSAVRRSYGPRAGADSGSAIRSTFATDSAPETWIDPDPADETWIAMAPSARAEPTTAPTPTRPEEAQDAMPIVVDLCTGSAAVALAVAIERPGTRVIAVEISDEALAWARRNLTDHAEALAGAHSALRLVAADATTCADTGGPLADLRSSVDVVVTNPPYVPDDATPRDPEVRDHDPHAALYGGPDGLGVIRRLATQAALLLGPGGRFVVEHADEQGEDAGRLGVPGLLRAAPGTWLDVRDHPDLTGRPRYTTAVRRPAQPLDRMTP